MSDGKQKDWSQHVDETLNCLRHNILRTGFYKILEMYEEEHLPECIFYAGNSFIKRKHPNFNWMHYADQIGEFTKALSQETLHDGKFKVKILVTKYDNENYDTMKEGNEEPSYSIGVRFQYVLNQ